MSIEIKVYLAEDGGIGSLGAWLQDVPEVATTPVPGPSRPGEQGGAWEFLSVLCGTGGAVKFALDALTTWIESKSTRVRVKIGDVEMELSGPDPQVLEGLIEAASKAAQIEP
jgi:hypothetical protein